MADIDLAVSVSRTALGLTPLILAPSAIYYLSTQFLGAAVTWTRQQVTSPFVDGSVTTQRSRANVVETVAVEIQTADNLALQAATVELLQAFLQDSFVLSVTVNSAAFSYACETADYQVVTWSTPRLVSNQGQIVFQVPRQPVPLTGGY